MSRTPMPRWPRGRIERHRHPRGVPVVPELDLRFVTGTAVADEHQRAPQLGHFDAPQLAHAEYVAIEAQHPRQVVHAKHGVQQAGFEHRFHVFSTLPGFMMPFGSKARLIARISSSSTGGA